jgi:peroxiredoxin Q/BCP
VSEHKLAPGDKAPDFILSDADGKPVSLSSLRGQQVIVYFYPAAMTPGCTTEACDFRDNLSSLAAAGVTVLGISPDGPAKLAKFRDRDHLTRITRWRRRTARTGRRSSTARRPWA